MESECSRGSPRCRILAVVAKTNDALDLHHVLSYPITEVPLSLAHTDGTLLKTDKATFTKTIESRQETVSDRLESKLL